MDKPTLDERWRDLQQVVQQSVEQMTEIAQRMTELLAEERESATSAREQVKAVRWVVRELGADSEIGCLVARLGDLIEKGVAKL